MTDLNSFAEWVNAKSGRSAEIRISNCSFDTSQTIWVFDVYLRIGNLVTSVEEIDLEGDRARRDLIQRKFETPDGVSQLPAPNVQKVLDRSAV